MKNTRKTVESRRRQIMELVHSRGEISVEELAELCGVSLMTVRRDLNALDAEEQLQRMHGRAVSIRKANTLEQADRKIRQCREAISEYAAGLVGDGETIFINGSRTALNLLHYINGRHVKVYTNNGWAVGEKYPEDVRIHLIGGELYDHIMIGEYVISHLLSISADRTFIGCGAVYDDGEFRYDIPTEIGINEMMLGRTRGPFYILADHSKLQRRESKNNSYGSFRYHQEVTMVTDEMADYEMTGRLEELGIKVIRVPVFDDPGTA